MKKSTAKKSTKKINKSDFVRSFEDGTPAKVIVVQAAKKGIKLTERYVYVIRSADKAKSRNGKVPGVFARVTYGKRKPSSDASALRQAIAEVGLAEARRVLAECERAFGA
jgi:hypothetical protein